MGWKSWRTIAGLDRFSGLYLLAVFILIFGIWTPSTFLTAATVHSIASEQAIAGMIAIALLISMACGQFDLSVGANANLCGIMAVVLQISLHWSVAAAVVFSVAVGITIGLVNGFVVIRLRVSSFIATLGMGSILAAVQTIVTSQLQPPPVTTSSWINLTQTSVGGFQIVVVYLFLVAVVAWWFLEHTPIGRYFYASGANPDAARLSGIQVDRLSWTALTITGGIAGLSGVLFTSLSGPALAFGPELLLPAFAAVFLGSTQLRPGRFNVWGTLLAIFVLATGVAGMQLVSGQQWLSDMFNGVALIVAVALAANRSANRPRWAGWLRRQDRSSQEPRASSDASMTGFGTDESTAAGTSAGRSEAETPSA
jgi:ribose transport system permease protein